MCFCSEISDTDRRRRVLVSLWHMSQLEGSSNCEFLGCMSFGVRHLLTKKRDISGWYHLLTQSAGTRKHLQVNTGRDQSGMWRIMMQSYKQL